MYHIGAVRCDSFGPARYSYGPHRVHTTKEEGPPVSPVTNLGGNYPLATIDSCLLQVVAEELRHPLVAGVGRVHSVRAD